MKHKELDPLDNIRSIAKVYGVDIDGLIEQKYQQGRADGLNELIEYLKPRLKWGNNEVGEVYRITIQQAIECAEMMRDMERKNETRN